MGDSKKVLFTFHLAGTKTTLRFGYHLLRMRFVPFRTLWYTLSGTQDAKRHISTEPNKKLGEYPIIRQVATTTHLQKPHDKVSEDYQGILTKNYTSVVLRKSTTTRLVYLNSPGFCPN
jgi:ATP adenylyltransferase/5',5'''-P-1,P-4-tetraphosphate phosphorylase II